MADFGIKANDRRPVLTVQLGYRKADDSFQPLDLTNALGVDFIMRLDNPTATTPKINAPCVIEEPKTDGIVTYKWKAGDTDTPAPSYRGEWEVQWPSDDSDPEPETFPVNSYFSITVYADLDSGA